MPIEDFVSHLRDGGPTERAAAAEIERLRAALQRIADMCPATCELTLAHEMADNAIAALNND